MPIATHRALPAEIRDIQDEMEALAASYGLDFFPTIFEFLEYDELSMFAAYGGFPVRYPHWRFGAEYDELSKGYSYGLQKIYEMVINTDPCYAYLLNCNTVMDQKLVIAHVYGHCDFFKNNAWFAHTNRKMLDQMANHAARVNRHIDRVGYEVVEEFIDACLSIEDLIDPHSVHIRRRPKPPTKEEQEAAKDKEPADGRFKSKGYMDGYINPPDVLAAERAEKERDEEAKAAVRNFPEEKQRDVLLFLLEHAPLKPWQHDILQIVRDEAYYFAPQGQTKIMNEGWACVAPETLVQTDRGLIPMAEVVAAEQRREPQSVADGEGSPRVTGSHILRDQARLTIRTKRGFTLTGSENHRVLCEDGHTWRRLDELCVGDAIGVAGGQGVWPTELAAVDWTPFEPVSLHDIADRAGVSVWTVLRHRAGRRTRSDAAIANALVDYDEQSVSAMAARRKVPSVPNRCDERLGEFLGHLVGDGHISRVKRTVGFTSGDRAAADRVAALVSDLFALTPNVRRDGNRFRVSVSSERLSDLLEHGLGLTTGPSASEKSVPEVVLQSPEIVVRAFLRALFDADGYAGPQGVILSTKSDALSRQVQLLLLNFGVLTSRRRQADGCHHVHATGRSAAVFEERIGFGLLRKQGRLREYVVNRKWFKQEAWTDEVVSIEHDRGDVYDITVEETHRYAAGGFINHNSYWHSTIMTKHGLTDAEVIDYADHHSGTMAMSPQRLNPYKVGIELLRDIEERWDKGQFGPEWDACDDEQVKKNWDLQTGLGREKIFEVRRVHNDVTFIDSFLTEDFCRKHKFFSFAYNQSSGDYEIASREFAAIKKQLLTSLTNHGRPRIFVTDGNFRNRGELYLKHDFQGVELKIDYARATLQNLQRLWSRPVHIETVVNEVPALLSFDGSDHLISSP